MRAISASDTSEGNCAIYGAEHTKVQTTDVIQLPEYALGHEGWLFARSAVEILSGPTSDAFEWLDAWRSELQNRTQQLSQRGVRYFHLCVPDKLSVVNEYWQGVENNSQKTQLCSPLAELTKRSKAGLDCLIDPTGYLRRQNGNYPIFWKTDTRWTPWSSYMSYQLFCGRLGVNANTLLMGYPFDELEQTMNLNAALAAPPEEAIRVYRFWLRSVRRFANELVFRRERELPIRDPLRSVTELGEGAQIIFENHHVEAIERCIIVFGDENCADNRDLFSGMLAETFSEVHFVWGKGIDYNYVDTVRPDIVITQGTELQLTRQPTTNFTMAVAAERSLERLVRMIPVDSSKSSVNPDKSACTEDSVQVILAGEQYALDPPLMVQAHGACESPETQMFSNEVTLMKVSDARVYFTGPSWRVQDAQDNELLHHEVPTLGYGEYLKRRRSLKGTTLMLATSAGAHCYYHWMLEILPKLGMLERAGIQIADIDYFLVRQITAQWQKETLARFGIHDSKVVETVDNPYYKCEHLLHIDLNCGINLRMNRFIPQWMKHLYPLVASDEPRLKLYISRPVGVRRGISNEAEFLPLLESAGFTVMSMEGLSVAEQAALMSRVDVLMSPHGGALTNMVFCRPGVAVIELFSRHVFPYYYGLAANCGHRYHAILENPGEDYARLVNAAVAQNFAPTQNETANVSFEAPVEVISQLLTKLQSQV